MTKLQKTICAYGRDEYDQECNRLFNEEWVCSYRQFQTRKNEHSPDEFYAVFIKYDNPTNEQEE